MVSHCSTRWRVSLIHGTLTADSLSLKLWPSLRYDSCEISTRNIDASFLNQNAIVKILFKAPKCLKWRVLISFSKPEAHKFAMQALLERTRGIFNYVLTTCKTAFKVLVRDLENRASCAPWHYSETILLASCSNYLLHLWVNLNSYVSFLSTCMRLKRIYFGPLMGHRAVSNHWVNTER